MGKGSGIAERNGPVPDNIKRVIASKGLLQGAVAKTCGMSKQQFSDLLNGRRLIKACDIPVICKALLVTPDELFQIGAQAEIRNIMTRKTEAADSGGTDNETEEPQC